MVLESVANDYESLDNIAEQIAKWTGTSLRSLDAERIKATLADAIDAGYVEACDLNSTTPTPMKVSMPSDCLDRYWFLITEQGKVICRETRE